MSTEDVTFSTVMIILSRHECLACKYFDVKITNLIGHEIAAITQRNASAYLELLVINDTFHIKNVRSDRRLRLSRWRAPVDLIYILSFPSPGTKQNVGPLCRLFSGRTHGNSPYRYFYFGHR